MRSFVTHGALVLSSIFIAVSCASLGIDSKLILPANFSPPPVFKNTNLLRTIDLTKPYSREIIATIVENISGSEQSEYFVPFDKDVVDKVSYIDARDKKGPLGNFKVSKVEFNPESTTQYYRVLFSEPLGVGEQITLQFATGTTSVIKPVPAEIQQTDKQFLQWTGRQYVASAYVTDKQKTKLKLPNNEVAEFTKLSPKADGMEDPVNVGSTFTYGPYETVNPSQKGGESISIRYEYTHPVIIMDKFAREIEISHWGGNLAIEEKYTMTNNGAKLKDHFSRVKWAATNYYSPPTPAIKLLTYNLKVGALSPYFTDEIGNVSTSRFRNNAREAHLELKPRYPVFGGWNYTYTLGWNHELGEFVRGSPNGEDFVLRIPFLEGPKEPVVYGEVEVTVILPEGASDVKYSVPIPIVKEERYLHKTFMDTIGRTAIKLSLSNVVDEQHNKELIVTYHLPATAGLRKPAVIFTALSTLFTFSWIISKIDTRIGK